MEQGEIPIVVRLFIKFLKKNKVYSLYRERCDVNSLSKFSHNYAKYYISGYFIWKGSEKKMWGEINKKWKKILKKNKL
jgi:hypothetical protein